MVPGSVTCDPLLPIRCQCATKLCAGPQHARSEPGDLDSHSKWFVRVAPLPALTPYRAASPVVHLMRSSPSSFLFPTLSLVAGTTSCAAEETVLVAGVSTIYTLAPVPLLRQVWLLHIHKKCAVSVVTWESGSIPLSWGRRRVCLHAHSANELPCRCAGGVQDI